MVTAALFAMSGLAVAGELPGTLQDAASTAADHVGVSLPDGHNADAAAGDELEGARPAKVHAKPGGQRRPRTTTGAKKRTSLPAAGTAAPAARGDDDAGESPADQREERQAPQREESRETGEDRGSEEQRSSGPAPVQHEEDAVPKPEPDSSPETDAPSAPSPDTGSGYDSRDQPVGGD